MRYNKERAEKFMEQIKTNPTSSKVGVMTNDLLTEFHRGYPIENLRPLLVHENEDFVRIGVWIASELGEKGAPLLSDVVSLLSHPRKEVRFSAIDCVLAWAAHSNAIEIVSTISLLDDPESGIRWKVMDFLARVSLEQLQAALSYLDVTEPQSAQARGLRWLLSSDARNDKEVISTLQSEDGFLRKYGVVAATRMARVNRDPVVYASSIRDPDVKGFADSAIRLL